MKIQILVILFSLQKIEKNKVYPLFCRSMEFSIMMFGKFHRWMIIVSFYKFFLIKNKYYRHQFICCLKKFEYTYNNVNSNITYKINEVHQMISPWFFIGQQGKFHSISWKIPKINLWTKTSSIFQFFQQKLYSKNLIKGFIRSVVEKFSTT